MKETPKSVEKTSNVVTTVKTVSIPAKEDAQMPQVDISRIVVGAVAVHQKFGEGTITSIDKHQKLSYFWRAFFVFIVLFY